MPRRCRGLPTRRVLQRLRQVPVIEGRERCDAVGDELVEEPVVEVEALRLARRCPAGISGATKSRTDTQRRRAPSSTTRRLGIGDSDRRRRRRCRRCGSSRRVRERVPDRRATAILADGAFDLIGGGSGAPEKSRGICARGFAPGGRTVARPSAGRGGGRRRPEGGGTDHGKLASREPFGNGRLRN